MEKSNDKRLSEKETKLIKKLETICDIEASKSPEIMDDDLIMECVYYLLEMKGEKHLSQEEIEVQIDSIPFIETDENVYENDNVIVMPKKKINKPRMKKRVFALVACIMALLVACSVASIAFEKDIVHIVAEWFGGICNIPTNTEYKIGNESFVVTDKPRKYKTVEEAVKAEKLDVLYPTKLPGELEVLRIFCYKYEGVDIVSYAVNSPDYSMSVWLNQKASAFLNDCDATMQEIGGFKCYICDLSSISSFQVAFEYKDNLYIILVKNEEEIISIIENMEELHYD